MQRTRCIAPVAASPEVLILTNESRMTMSCDSRAHARARCNSHDVRFEIGIDLPRVSTSSPRFFDTQQDEFFMSALSLPREIIMLAWERGLDGV